MIFSSATVGCENNAGSSPWFQSKPLTCEIENRPLGVNTGRHPTEAASIYPAMALRTNIAKNIPDRDNPINLVVARSFMASELVAQMSVP